MRLAAQHFGAAAHGHEEPAKGAQLPPQKRCPPDDRARVHLPASLAQSCRAAQRVLGLSEVIKTPVAQVCERRRPDCSSKAAHGRLW